MRLSIRIATLALVIGLAACTGASIENVDSQPVVSGSGRHLSTEHVREAITRAGTALGWVIRPEGPNKLVGTLTLRGNTAVVDIPYDHKSYSITYRSSTGLLKKDGKIHKNYNGWIQNLTKGINAELGRS